MMESEEPVPKKARTGSLEDLVENCWCSYLRYLDSVQEDNPDGDTDELLEIVESCLPYVEKPSSKSIPKLISSRQQLLPLMVSVASSCLADAAIADALRESDNTQIISDVRNHVSNALEFCPWNASAWSMAANWGRMRKSLSASQLGFWYVHIANVAHDVRETAIRVSEDEQVENDVKEWVELLLLNQIAGVELEGDDDDEFWSASAVEGTARFMAAMQLSIMGDHDTVLQHLSHFNISHRLHPNIWSTERDKETPKIALGQGDPAMYKRTSGVLLPTDLYSRICHLFCPDAPYWKESCYEDRGYYSYFMDRPPENESPRNLIEDVIVNHMLPAVELQVGKSSAKSICGFEWWVHTRPIQANLGHNLHFDTDEAMLSQEGKITHPLVSSVLYLTGGSDGGGPTIILDQKPNDQSIPTHGWQVSPRDNNLMLFPGNLLHGVLPCQGLESSKSEHSTSLHPIAEDLWSNSSAAPTEKNRLTFMVGFWTRRVPDKMKSRSIYGPCGPIPEASDENTWAASILEGYESPLEADQTCSGSLQRSEVHKVQPVWETLAPRVSSETDPLLPIPKAIDHRFFVDGAPHCFHRALFERDEFDSDELSGESDGSDHAAE